MKTIVWTLLAICILGLVVLSGCTSPLSATGPARLGTSQDQATIQTLQRRLLERERTIAQQNYQIEVMASQLDALKRIEQDTQAQRGSVRRSVIVRP